MKKHTFYILKSLLIIIFLSLIVLSEYGIPFFKTPNTNYINYDKLWYADTNLSGASPIVLNNHQTDTVVLIVHDYKGTPKNVRGLANVLNKNGYNVYVPLLPGHGTTKKDLDKTELIDWYNHVYKAYSFLKLKYKKIIGIGVSEGGAILLKLIIEKKININKIVLISTPVMLFGYTRWSYKLKDIRYIFSGILRLIYDRMKAANISKNKKLPESWSGYRNYFNIDQIHTLKIRLRKIKKHCFKINHPVLIIQSPKDMIYSFENAEYIYNHVSSKIKELVKFQVPSEDNTFSHHLLLNKFVKNKVNAKILNFLTKTINNR